LLSIQKIEVLISRNFGEEYSSMFIFFHEKGFSENIRFNRKEAILPFTGRYNYYTRTYSDGFVGEPTPIEDVDHENFKIDWSL
jgi:hypothetical protein